MEKTWEKQAIQSRNVLTNCGDGWTGSGMPSWSDDLLEDITNPTGSPLDPVIPGSLSHFFDAMSLGQHTLGGVEYGVYTAEHPLVWYAQNYGTQNFTAIRQANKDILIQAEDSIPFEEFDLTGNGSQGPDGKVDYVFILWQSVHHYDESAEPPVFYSLGSGAGAVSWLLPENTTLTLDGKTLSVESGSTLWNITAPIGSQFYNVARNRWNIAATAAHEYGHDLSAISDYGGGSHVCTESRYGIMQGYTTPGTLMMSGLMRYMLGWIAPATEIAFPTSFPFDANVTLSTSYPDGNACFAIIRTPVTGTAEQFFILEGRKANLSGEFYNTAQPSNLPQCCMRTLEVGDGLLISHVRRGGSAKWFPAGGGGNPPPLLDIEVATGRFNTSTGAPDPDRGFTLIAADSRDFCNVAGSLGNLSGKIGDLFKPQTGVEFFSNVFAPYTNPNSNLYAETPPEIRLQSIYSGISIYDVQWDYTGEAISFKVHIDDPAITPAGKADTIRVDTTWQGLVQLTGDLAIKPGKGLVIEPGTTVVAGAGADRLSGGTQSSLVEIIPFGLLDVRATSTARVPFISSRSPAFKNASFRSWVPESGTAAPGDWHGLRVRTKNYIDQSAIKYSDFEFAKFAVELDSLSGTLFHPRFTSSQNGDVHLTQDFKILDPQNWTLDAPAKIVVSNDDASGQGDPERIEWIVYGIWETNSANPGVDSVKIVPELPTSGSGDDWNGITVLDGADLELRYVDIGYAEIPITLVAALGSEIRNSRIHHYAVEGVLDISSHSLIDSCVVKRGTGMSDDLGNTGIHLYQSAATVTNDSLGWHRDYGIKAEWSSSFCGQPIQQTPRTLTFSDNVVEGNSEPTSIGDHPETGIFATWICDSTSSRIEDNLIRYWQTGLSLANVSDTYIGCNAIGDNLRGVAFDRGTSMLVTTTNGNVKINQNGVKSNYDTGYEIPRGLGLRIGDGATPPDPGRNSIQLDPDTGHTSLFKRVVIVDPDVPTSVLDARKNTWIKGNGTITTSQQYILEHVSQDFVGQINSGLPRTSEGLCTTMPIMTAGLASIPSEDEGALEGRLEHDENAAPHAHEVVVLSSAESGDSFRIRFGIPMDEGGRIQIEIFNLQGRRVRALHQSDAAPGWHEVLWDARDSNGNRVAAGVYFARYSAGSFVKTLKLVKLQG